MGFWKGLLDTWTASSLHPTDFFPLAGETQDNTSAIFYYICVGVAAIIIMSLLTFPFTLLSSFLQTHQSGNPALFPLVGGLSFLEILVWIILSPLFLFLGLFVWAGITHLFLMIVGGARGGFSTTLRTISYAYSPTVIPFVGGIWSFILLIIGLSKAHQTEIWRPIVAIIIEVITCVIVVAVPIVILAAMFAGKLHGVSP